MTALFILFALSSSEIAPPALFAGNEELRAYLLEAGENHPGLRMRHEQWLAALERIPQVKSLDDPMFTYGQFLQSEVNRFKAGLSQKFPWYHTRRVRGEKAAEEADAALARFYAERNVVFADVKRAYFEYALLAESLRVVESQADVLKYMQGTAESRYALGMAMQADVVRAQLAQTRLQDQYDSLLLQRSVLAAQLCEALGRNRREELPWPQEAVLPPAPPPEAVVSARLRVANPSLTALDHLIRSREKQVVLARKRGFPDFTVGVEFVSISKPRQIRPDRPYPATLNAIDRRWTSLQGNRTAAGQAIQQVLTGQPVQLPGLSSSGAPLLDAYSIATANEPMAYSDGGEDNIMVSVQMNVPIWRGRVKAGMREARHLVEAARHEKRKEANSLDAAAQGALIGYQDARRRLNVLRDALMVQAREVHESLLTAYASATGDASFLDVLASVNDLLDFELEQAQVLRDLQFAAADLELLMGGPWAAETGTAPSEGP
jgi:outer membrane protein, heavy metal efflux system